MSKIIIQIDEDLADIVPEFLMNRKDEVPNLWAALKKLDYDYIQTIGHRLKGNAGGYGFDQMGHIGAEIEQAAKLKNDPRIEAALKELQNYLANVEVSYVKSA